MKKTSCKRGGIQIIKVILSLTQDLQRLPLVLINSMRGRSRIKYKMTTYFKDEALNKNTFRAPLHCGFTRRPSSSRPCGRQTMRDIGAGHTLYPALQACGVTKRVVRGFTLIELLVVVLIIGILAAVALPQYQKAVLRSRFGAMKNLVVTLANAEKLYYLTHGDYTIEMNALDITPSEKPYKIEKITYPQPSEIHYFSWGSCRSMKAPGGPHAAPTMRVGCSVEQKQNSQVTYAIWFHLPANQPSYTAVRCIAYDRNNKRGQELCKQETGKTKEDYIDSGDWYHYYY